MSGAGTGPKAVPRKMRGRNRVVGGERMFWAHRRQPGNNPESHKLSGQVLLNDVPGNLSVLRIELQLIFMWSTIMREEDSQH